MPIYVLISNAVSSLFTNASDWKMLGHVCYHSVYVNLWSDFRRAVLSIHKSKVFADVWVQWAITYANSVVVLISDAVSVYTNMGLGDVGHVRYHIC